MTNKTCVIDESVHGFLSRCAQFERREIKKVTEKAIAEYIEKNHPDLLETDESNVGDGLRTAVR